MKGKAGKEISLLDKLHTNVAEWRLRCNIQKKKIQWSQMMVGLKGLKVKWYFGEGGQDVAADVDVDMAAVFWDSSVVCLFTLCGILLTAKM